MKNTIKKISIVAVICLLSWCSMSLVQAADKPSPDMVRNQIQGGKIKAIYSTSSLLSYDLTLHDTIQFREDGFEQLAPRYTHCKYDAQNRLTYRMGYTIRDEEHKDLTYCFDTIIYKNNSDKRPLYIMKRYSEHADKVNYCDVRKEKCVYKRFYYQGNSSEPYALFEISHLTDNSVFEYIEYTYSDHDRYGNWTKVNKHKRFATDPGKAAVHTFCDFQMTPKERKELESVEIEGLKNSIWAGDGLEDEVREIIYY